MCIGCSQNNTNIFNNNIQGLDGLYGGYSSAWRFDSSSLSGIPLANYFRLNSSTFSSITSIIVSKTNKDNIDLTAFLNSFVNGSSYGKLRLFKEYDSSTFVDFNITNIVLSGSTFTITVSYILGNNSFSPNDSVVFTFTPNATTNDIIIPTPQIKIGKIDSTKNCPFLYAYYFPQGNENFQTHSPKYYLFMYKSKNNHKKKNISGAKIKSTRPSGFYHPTHLNGANFSAHTSFYGGSTPIPLNTEFSLTAPGSYIYTELGVNPFQYIKRSGAYIVLADTQNINPTDSFYFSGRAFRKTRHSRSITFCIAIGIQNPDITSKNPIIFGDFSNEFRLKFNSFKGNLNGLNYELQISSIKRNIS